MTAVKKIDTQLISGKWILMDIHLTVDIKNVKPANSSNF